MTKLHVSSISENKVSAKQEVITETYTETIKVIFKYKPTGEELASKEVQIVIDPACAETDLEAENFSVTYPSDLSVDKYFLITSTTQQDTMTNCLTRYSLLSQK